MQFVTFQRADSVQLHRQMKSVNEVESGCAQINKSHFYNLAINSSVRSMMMNFVKLAQHIENWRNTADWNFTHKSNWNCIVLYCRLLAFVGFWLFCFWSRTRTLDCADTFEFHFHCELHNFHQIFFSFTCGAKQYQWLIRANDQRFSVCDGTCFGLKIKIANKCWKHAESSDKHLDCWIWHDDQDIFSVFYLRC